MYNNGLITMGMSDNGYVSILPKLANRHGLIAGATGTGKTVTLKVMAESFSDAGVPVFLADVKGDLAGMCMPGVDSEDMKERIERFKLADMGFEFKSYPTRFWDIYGVKGMPLRTTVTEFGPLLLSRLLDLNQTQSDILTITFKIADDQNMLLIDLKDLRAMLSYVSENNSQFKMEYGNIAKSSVTAIIRALISLQEQGGDKFFGEPALDIKDWFTTSLEGKGMINVLASDSLINEPLCYSTFLLWMLSEIFEVMPEVGDLDKPKMVFFFDEAHLLFDGAPKVLLQKIEQVIKLVRSKGIGVYFVTQNPKDIPGDVLAQLSNKVQHALHAYTPAEQKGIKAAAESFRVNPAFKTEDAIQELGTGEALVSFLQEDGTPMIVEKAKILPPQSRMGTIDVNMRSQVIASDSIGSKYSEMIDRDSAYEFLARRGVEQQKAEEAEAVQPAVQPAAAQPAAGMPTAGVPATGMPAETTAGTTALTKEQIKAQKELEKQQAALEKEKEKERKKKARKVASVAGTAAGTVGREIGHSVGESIGGKFGKTLGGNVGASLGRGIIQTLFKL